ncbi:TPA: hypothetical protein DIC38_02735 [Candidatus Nomurabacteria bacterium]|nr:MAG: Capsule synthesis protein, CapA [Parcubacteria bacterium RAAC4_OD1_1]HCY26569.1 hypothetical protein [Candidatus Nomurabacteria bacterium]
MKIKTIIILIFISGLGFFVGAKIADKTYKINNDDQTASVSSLEEKEDYIPQKTTIYFVGDIMMTRGVEASVNKNFGGDFNKLFENLEELKNADILFGNLEGAVSDKGNNVGSKYSFRMKPEALEALSNIGFDIVSFANNHVGDWNIIAFKDTMVRLDNIGIKKTGAGINKEDAISPTILNKNGINFGFLGFSDVGPNWLEAKENTAGILLASDPNIKTIIKNAKSNVDVLIVSFHFGEEYKKVHNKRQETLAHLAIDNGADMVIGHHPHVIEDLEWYKEKPIVYSLGNFIFDQYFSIDTMKGMVFIATFDENKNLINTEQKEIILNRNYQPKGIFEKKDDNIIQKNTCPKTSKNFIDMSLYNVGKTNSLLELNYIPNNLIPLDTTISNEGLCLKENIKDAFIQMKNDAEKENIFIKITSAFRSYETQKLLYSEKEKVSSDAGLYLAKPGYSEHQLGTTIDISGLSIDYGRATIKFENTIEDIWLKENAYKYGFIQSYPKGKENITGYAYEPWHYRYVGIDNAKYIKENNLTIVEYLGSINKN